jgi:hypothetical protein
MAKLSIIRFLVLLAALSVGTVFAADEQTADDPVASYAQGYRTPVKEVCDTAFKPSVSLILQGSFPYPEIGDANSKQRYRDMVKGVGGDLSALQPIFEFDIPRTQTTLESVIPPKLRNDLAAASVAYKERTNALFACAEISFKIKTHESILESVRGSKADTGNMAKSLQKQTERLRQELDRRHCSPAATSADGNGFSLRKTLLDNAFYQYCDYRHYLQYLKTNISSRLAQASQNARDNGTPLKGSMSAESAVANIASSVSNIDSEISHTREVFPQAMVAYSEFERTYATHVVMLFIEEDYRLIRETLKKVMNPLGQVIYKASNAQSPYSR